MKSGSWPSILGIYLFGICGAATVSRIIPLTTDIGTHFGLATAQFGWLVALIAVPAAIFAIPSGMVVDRLGPKLVLILGGVGGVLANLVYIVAPSLGWIQAARVLEGFAIVHIYTAGPAMLMSTTEGNRRTRAMTLWSTYAPVGTALGLALGGMSAQTEAWTSVFWFHGTLFAVAAALCLFQPTLPIMSSTLSKGLAARLGDLGGAFVSPRLVLLSGAFFLLISLGLGANVTFPAHFAAVHEITLQMSSNMIASATLFMVAGSLGVGLLLPLGLRPQTLLTVLALTGFVSGSLCFYPGVHLGARYAVLIAWFVATGACMATMLAMLPTVAEAGRLGSAAALFNFVGAAATFVNPPLWLAISASGEWTPFIGLMAIGWALIIVLVRTIAMLVLRANKAATAA